jgi:hypothetical protein
MREVRLLLVEGMPGAGKSTLAQSLLHQLDAHGIAARWWYEEECAHPVYCFRTGEELRRVVDDLAGGQHRRVIDAALAQWRSFVTTVASGDEVVILDGCLFGYLTWSLFPYNVPAAEILEYVAQVAAILADAEPCVIFIRPDDVAASWQRLFAARGEAWTASAIERATTSPYGARHGLAGFDGLCAYWRAYQSVADEAFARLPFPTLALSMGAGQGSFLQAATDFLGLSVCPEAVASAEELARVVGTYVCRDSEGEVRAEIILRDGALFLAGVPHLWPQNRLIPLAGDTFAVEAFPFTLRFLAGSAERSAELRITGPRLLGGSVGGSYVRQSSD